MKTVPFPHRPQRWSAFLVPPRPVPPPPPPPIRSPLVDYLDDLVSRGGPEPAEYAALNECFRELAARGSRKADGPRLLEAARTALGPILIKGTLPGFFHLRPHGYPGDFELLERLLSYHHSCDPNLVRWDRYCHALPVARALRSRKAHLWTLLEKLEHLPPESPGRILSFRSGPARDVADYFGAAGGRSRLRCDCVDPDPNAALHGRRITARITDRLAFHTEPLLRFRPPYAYPLVWSSCLAEALDDRALVAVLRRVLHLLAPGGQAVLAHFAPGDVADGFLQVVGTWHLRCRTADQLESLAVEAGAYPDTTRVVSDPAHANLFLHVGRPLGPLRRRIRRRHHPRPVPMLVVETLTPTPSLARAA